MSSRSRTPISPRRRERILVFQALFMLDVGQVSWETASDYLHSENQDLSLRPWLEGRLRGAWGMRQQADERLRARLQNWSWERVGRVERSLMRLAVYEMLCCGEELPFSAAIGEAVELAREYGDEKAAPFVNGVLDAVWKAHQAVLASLTQQVDLAQQVGPTDQAHEVEVAGDEDR